MEKTYVRSLFDSIAHRYDLLNHVLSGGIDFYWRWRAIEHLKDARPGRILDVATGTGDFAIAALRLHPDAIVGVDIAEEMLKRGREKLRRRGFDSIITLRNCEAENLPFADGEFDAAIVAFGVRNFENLERGLREMHRVLKPGGKVVILEFSRPARFPFKQLYFFYFRNILPFIGGIVSKNKEAYAYLPDTVLRFPEGGRFLASLGAAGFNQSSQDRLTFGIATIYSGMK